jgi:hypothetical protein
MPGSFSMTYPLAGKISGALYGGGDIRRQHDERLLIDPKGPSISYKKTIIILSTGIVKPFSAFSIREISAEHAFRQKGGAYRRPCRLDEDGLTAGGNYLMKRMRPSAIPPSP